VVNQLEAKSAIFFLIPGVSKIADGLHFANKSTLRGHSNNKLCGRLKRQRTTSEIAMNQQQIEFMSMDELWSLREKVNSELARKIVAEKARLDHRLQKLSLSASVEKIAPTRRAYPRVFPKYANPSQPRETWSGRGKQPRWLAAQIRSGRRLEDFRIQPN